MDLTVSPVERTTATTSALLALLAFVAVIYLTRIQRKSNRLRPSFWLAGLFLLGLTGLVGSISHGFKFSGAMVSNDMDKWLDLGPILAAGMFLCGVAHDLHGPVVARQTLPFIVAIGFVFYLIALQLAVPSISIAAYQTIAMLPAFIFYSWLATRFQFDGAGWISLGAVLFILAAWLRANRQFQPEWVWSFNTDAISNVVCTLSVLTLAVGLRIYLVPYRKIGRNRIKHFLDCSGNRLHRR